jgi:hypothetical protein
VRDGQYEVARQRHAGAGVAARADDHHDRARDAVARGSGAADHGGRGQARSDQTGEGDQRALHAGRMSLSRRHVNTHVLQTKGEELSE